MILGFIGGLDRENNSYNWPHFLTNSFKALDFHQDAFKALFVNHNLLGRSIISILESDDTFWKDMHYVLDASRKHIDDTGFC